MRKKLIEERLRLDDFVDTLENDIKNRSFEDRLDIEDELYLRGQIAACESFSEFLDEVIGEEENAKTNKKNRSVGNNLALCGLQ